MGGQSFKCPRCSQWFLEKYRLRDHLISVHNEPKVFTLEGVAEHTRIVRDGSASPTTDA